MLRLSSAEGEVSMKWQKWGWAALYILAPVLLVYSVYAASPARFGSAGQILPVALGCIAYTMMCAQLILAARIPAIERVFGLDRLIRFHGMAAGWALVLAAAHKLLMHGGAFRFRPLHTGDLSLLLFLLLGILAAVFLSGRAEGLKKKWARTFWGRYDRELMLHRFMAAAVLLMFLHASGKPFMRTPLSGTVLVLCFAAGMGCFLWHTWLRRGKSFTVAKVIRENNSMTTLVMAPNRGSFSYKPGQFGFLSVKDPALSGEAHPFSFSSSPGRDASVSMTIRALGDWTGKVKEIRPGSQARIDGPYGRFSPLLYPEEEPVVLIAGGVGITPMLSIVRYYEKKNRNKPVLLLWCARDRRDLIARADWERCREEMQHFAFCPVLSRDEGGPGYHGRISRDILEKALGESGISAGAARFYFCGPAPLEQAVRAILKDLGVPRSRIVSEQFSL